MGPEVLKQPRLESNRLEELYAQRKAVGQGGRPKPKVMLEKLLPGYVELKARTDCSTCMPCVCAHL